VVVAKLAWIVRNTIRKSGIIKIQMFLKTFRKPSEYNSYYTENVRDVYQLDLMSLSRIYYFFGYETLKGIKKPKGQWVLVTIDLYSRYIVLQYIGNTATIENIIKHLEITFHKIGKPKILEAEHQFNTKLFRNFLNEQGIRPYFFKGQETNKNAVVESNIKTVKNLILKYIYNFGIPKSI